MENEKSGKRLEKRRKKFERRRIERDKVKLEAKRNVRIDLFMKIGIFSVLALIVVDFFVSMWPIFYVEQMSFGLASMSFFLMQVFGILFGLGLYFAGKKALRDTGIYGGVFQIDGSIIAILNLSIFLIANPLRYTQADLIINSLYFGIDTISSISFLIFSFLIAFFFILVGSSGQKQPLRYIVMITGVLWLAELFLPSFSPSPYTDPLVYSIISGFTWVVYGLTAYCLWKILYEFEGLKPAVGAPYRIK